MKSPILALVLAGISTISLPAEDLPVDVANVLEKLGEFEAQERIKAEQIIRDKQLQVVKFLQGALDRETKAGNLEGALLIKAKIESLGPKATPEKPTMPAVGANEDFLGEWTWFIADQKLILERGNKAYIQLPGGGAKLEAQWQPSGDSRRSIEVSWGGDDNTARIKFDAAYATGDIRGKNGGNEFSAELKRIR